MRYAQAIRAFLSALFGSNLVAELRAELIEARKERDYFRGQFERMQLLVGHIRATPATTPRQVTPGGLTREGARRSWAQIQAAHTKEQYPDGPAKSAETQEPQKAQN
jgi:hypothetical protein